jgi:NAD(P)-dependent dehydrogenase (short-subunit alcohol dehydrogenase family)
MNTATHGADALENHMADARKTIIVTGASQGIGAAVANLFLERGYNVVANSRHITNKNELRRSDNLALLDGDIALAATADRIMETGMERFGSVHGLVNNAGIFIAKPFIDYTPAEFRALSATNLEGFIYITQRFIKQLLTQKSGGSVVNITACIASHPLAPVPASVAMITKGGLDAVTRSLALEYGGQGIRVNAVAPGIVDTPLHANVPRDFLRTLSPLGQIAAARDIAAAVLYLSEADQVTGEVLYVSGGAHIGKW